MKLGELITRLTQEDPAKVVARGFDSPHSYRGYYDELAFEPAESITVGAMLKAAMSAAGATFQGYKGGDFRMNAKTRVWLAEWGNVGEEIEPEMLDAMLAAPAPTPAPAGGSAGEVGELLEWLDETADACAGEGNGDADRLRHAARLIRLAGHSADADDDEQATRELVEWLETLAKQAKHVPYVPARIAGYLTTVRALAARAREGEGLRERAEAAEESEREMAHALAVARRERQDQERRTMNAVGDVRWLVRVIADAHGGAASMLKAEALNPGTCLLFREDGERMVREIVAQRDEARREAAALREDAERLDFLGTFSAAMLASLNGGGVVVNLTPASGDAWATARGATLRDALDTARAAAGGAPPEAAGGSDA